ncbi:hypothetical protein SH601_17180 [Gracilibacillus sp. S3-1-1]|uniref:Uncharacterized protein n=1 Tax=Gracilibacillus pellucidus TaxID=3095368 RepID=A0ACC6M9N5_9BACI|nr:hypothetical protein [Gracilibacillus sp. S3-1-1]MDX8047695.1 hypothetical protein [Gracilibacillus sp. S3-1-1]
MKKLGLIALILLMILTACQTEDSAEVESDEIKELQVETEVDKEDDLMTVEEAKELADSLLFRMYDDLYSVREEHFEPEFSQISLVANPEVENESEWFQEAMKLFRERVSDYVSEEYLDEQLAYITSVMFCHCGSWPLLNGYGSSDIFLGVEIAEQDTDSLVLEFKMMQDPEYGLDVGSFRYEMRKNEHEWMIQHIEQSQEVNLKAEDFDQPWNDRYTFVEYQDDDTLVIDIGYGTILVDSKSGKPISSVVNEVSEEEEEEEYVEEEEEITEPTEPTEPAYTAVSGLNPNDPDQYLGRWSESEDYTDSATLRFNSNGNNEYEIMITEPHGGGARLIDYEGIVTFADGKASFYSPFDNFYEVERDVAISLQDEQIYVEIDGVIEHSGEKFHTVYEFGLFEPESGE